MRCIATRRTGMAIKTENREASQKSGAAQTYMNYIGGRWVKARSGETFSSHNPADTNDLVGHFASSSPDDVKDAVDAAAKAFPDWKRTPAPYRAELLMKAS